MKVLKAFAEQVANEQRQSCSVAYYQWAFPKLGTGTDNACNYILSAPSPITKE